MPITNKILIDEMDDGMDEKLNSLGYDAYSIKKLRAEGKKLHTDYSVSYTHLTLPTILLV